MVSVDEAQAFSPMQLSFSLLFTRPGGRLLFVGDTKQTIYGFAEVDTCAMSWIVDRTQATVLTFSVTYRCPPKCVRLAQQSALAIQAAPGAAAGGSRTDGVSLPGRTGLFACRREGYGTRKRDNSGKTGSTHRGLFEDVSGMVTLSTVHMAEAKEVDNVFILLPHLMSLPNAESPEEQEAKDCGRLVTATGSRRKLVFVELNDVTSTRAWWRNADTAPMVAGASSSGATRSKAA